MDIRVSQEKGRVPVTVLYVTGEVDASSYEQLQEAAQQLVDGGARDLLLDLGGVKYISSAGLRALNYIFVLVRDASGESKERVGEGIRSGSYQSPHLKLLNPSSDVARVLNTAGFDMFLETFRDQRKAVESF